MATMLSLIILLSLCLLTRSKIYEIYHRDHFHDYLCDNPIGSRYASVVAFYNDTSTCDMSSMSWWNEDDMPSEEHLFLGQYEMSNTQERTWYEWTEHMDLAKYLGVEEYINSQPDPANCECPILVFIPFNYAEELGDDYLKNPSTENVQIWENDISPPPTLQMILSSVLPDGTQSSEEAVYDGLDTMDWKAWVWMNMKQTIRVAVDFPFDLEVTIKHDTKNKYLDVMQSPTFKWVETVHIDSIQSHTELTVYPGDTIQISKDPVFTEETKKKIYGTKPRGDHNPIYEVHCGMDLLHVMLMDDNTWGFDDDRDKSLSPSFVRRRHLTTIMTHTRNLVLPHVLPSTHPLGFYKSKMPPGLHERLVEYYRKWYHEHKAENWELTSTQINFASVKTHMVTFDLDPTERNSIAENVVMPLMLDWVHSNGWTNITGLKFNAFYGIREYSRAASLRLHVDRVDTHVVSAILQIAQSAVEEPWPLQVIGFDGNVHEVTLQPGEMIFYEGHRLPHARPYPFNGTRFSNAFIHYSPVGWEWTTGKVWKSKEAKEAMKKLHVTWRDIHA